MRSLLAWLPFRSRGDPKRYEGKPGWFSLIARAASPQALLPFRYVVRTVLLVTPGDAWQTVKQVAAGMNPAAIAMQVRLRILVRPDSR